MLAARRRAVPPQPGGGAVRQRVAPRPLARLLDPRRDVYHCLVLGRHLHYPRKTKIRRFFYSHRRAIDVVCLALEKGGATKRRFHSRVRMRVGKFISERHAVW